MKCVYPNGVALTKDQIEKLEGVSALFCEVFESIKNFLKEAWSNLAKHPFFQSLCKLAIEPSGKPASLHKSIKRVQPKFSLPTVPKLDRRCRLHVIRNNC